MGNSNVFKRNAGILMAISSLPSPYGIGTLGKDAYEFVDFVRDSNHKYWQVLPVGPTTYGDSPYQPYSAFAGNPYFVDLDMLIEEGLLLKSEVIAVDWGDGIIPVEVSEDDAVNNRYPQEGIFSIISECDCLKSAIFILNTFATSDTFRYTLLL